MDKHGVSLTEAGVGATVESQGEAAGTLLVRRLVRLPLRGSLVTHECQPCGQSQPMAKGLTPSGVYRMPGTLLCSHKHHLLQSHEWCPAPRGKTNPPYFAKGKNKAQRGRQMAQCYEATGWENQRPEAALSLKPECLPQRIAVRLPTCKGQCEL